jgi:3-hydroxyisobutyrate dehydrogenase-like beta-hydroxyacid dehydrogenase
MSPTAARELRIAVLGLGEAGGALAHDLVAAGSPVRGYDPRVAAPPGVVDTGSEADAVAGSDLVLSVNSASAAVDALRAGLAGARPGCLWADLNTASPALKRRLGEIAADAGAGFADVSLMAPVPGRGLRTPMLVSGTEAGRYAGLLRPLGATVDVLAGPAGLAAERKLLRSVFFKGLAAAVVEALEAARAAGCEDWLRENMADELARADAATVDRLVDGSRRHAVRRTAEMQAAADMLDDLGVPPLITTAGRDVLRRLSGRQGTALRAAHPDSGFGSGR